MSNLLRAVEENQEKNDQKRKDTLDDCRRALDSFAKFKQQQRHQHQEQEEQEQEQNKCVLFFDGRFELLMLDSLLAVQTCLWTQTNCSTAPLLNRSLFNESLVKYRKQTAKRRDTMRSGFENEYQNQYEENYSNSSRAGIVDECRFLESREKFYETIILYASNRNPVNLFKNNRHHHIMMNFDPSNKKKNNRFLLNKDKPSSDSFLLLNNLNRGRQTIHSSNSTSSRHQPPQKAALFTMGSQVLKNFQLQMTD